MRVVPRIETDKNEVGENIRLQREAQGLSQDDLADRMGSTRQFISRHESGTQEMRLVTFIQYCEALNVSPELLFPDRLRNSNEGNMAYRLLKLTADMTEEDQTLLFRLAQRLKGDQTQLIR